MAELSALYRQADEAYASYRCEGTTECCRFAITGREPYVTSIELLALQRAVAARGGPVKPARRALPLVRNSQERTCPLLNADARCAVYQARPLGCRSYWCHRAQSDAPVSQKQLNALVGKLKDIAARHRTGGEHGRPITRCVE